MPRPAEDKVTQAVSKLKISTDARSPGPPRSSRSRSRSAQRRQDVSATGTSGRKAVGREAAIADSWDDDDDDEEEGGEDDTLGIAQKRATADEPPASPAPPTKAGSRAPPPTPATASPSPAALDWSSSRYAMPSQPQFRASGFGGSLGTQAEEDELSPGSTRGVGGDGNGRRPEKSTAVASRLIAAGLGVKAPRRTEEQREYDAAMRAQERRKKEKAAEEERRRKEQSERARQAIWDD